MNSVFKNIRRLRKRDNISQEILAEKLSVTRQAVSNWETGKTQPDIDTLVSISAVFNVDVTELIYGEKQNPEACPEDRENRIIRACIFGALSAGFVLLEIFVVPYYKNLMGTHYILYPYIIIAYVLRPLFYICNSLFFFHLLSLWFDFRIKRTAYRKVVLLISLSYITFIFLFVVNYFVGIIPINSSYLSLNIMEPLMRNPALFLIPGTALFFGLNK